jgi:hypothetical protein
MNEPDYSPRVAVRKLGVKEGERVEVVGDVGPGLRDCLKIALGRGLARGGELDGAIVGADSLDDAKEALVRYRARIKDSGYLWVVTRKRGHDRFLDQMQIVPIAKRVGMIDNKTCSLDEDRSGIRFVVPRAMRRDSADAA